MPRHIFFVCALFLFSGCSTFNVSVALPQTSSLHAPKVRTNMDGYFVTSTAESGSCFWYSLMNEQGQQYPIPEIEEHLVCYPPQITPDGEQLVYSDGDNLRLFDFEKKTYPSILSVVGYEGVSTLWWSPSGNRFLLVVVDQEHIDTATRIIVFDKKEATWVNSGEYDVRVTMTCGSICSPSEEDIRFVDNKTIEYRTWEEVPYDLEDEEAFRTLLLE